MPSSKEYVQWVLETLAPVGNVRVRAMMGEYVLYYKEKVVGGIYDERFLVKNIPAAAQILDNPPLEIPYEGAKPMLLIDSESLGKAQLCALMDALYNALPVPKSRRKAAKRCTGK